MVLPTIVRKQLGETRWSLFFTFIAFFGLTLLWNWGVSVNQYPPPEFERAMREAEDREGGPPPLAQEKSGASSEATPKIEDPDSKAETKPAQNEEASKKAVQEQQRERPGRRRGMGIYMAFGVPADRMMDRDDPPTLLMQVAMANHPLVFLALIGWAIARGAASVAGEIERGTLDLTLSRPVYRSTYLTSQVLTTVATFVLLALAIVAGHFTSQWIFKLNQPPGLMSYLPSVLMMLGLGLSIYGYTLVLSSLDIVRARVGILGLGITLAGLSAIVFSQQYEGYEWLKNLSVINFYEPVKITASMTNESARRMGILYAVFAVGSALSYFFFLRRDLPTSAG
jgi:beta-exotoxin I transport system permease protein